jgi:hypothetical protein
MTLPVAAVLALAGCSASVSTSSNPTIDPAKIEPILVKRLAANAGVSPRGVTLDCPSGEPAVEGTKFDCTLTAADGSKAEVNATVTSVERDGGQVNYHVDATVPRGQFK